MTIGQNITSIFSVIPYESQFAKSIRSFIDGLGSIEDAISALDRAESDTGVSIRREGLSHPDDCILGTLDHRPDLRSKLHRFLQQAPFLLGSHEFRNYEVHFDDGMVLAPSDRAWGACLADWANESRLGGRSDWDYVTFAFYAESCFSDYENWAAALSLILDSKSRQP